MVHNDDERVQAAMEVDAEFLLVDAENLARSGGIGPWSMAGLEGRVVHQPGATHVARGQRSDVHVADIERETFDATLGDVVPQVLVSHMEEPLVPEEKGVHRLRAGDHRSDQVLRRDPHVEEHLVAKVQRDVSTSTGGSTVSS